MLKTLRKLWRLCKRLATLVCALLFMGALNHVDAVQAWFILESPSVALGGLEVQPLRVLAVLGRLLLDALIMEVM